MAPWQRGQFCLMVTSCSPARWWQMVQVQSEARSIRGRPVTTQTGNRVLQDGQTPQVSGIIVSQTVHSDLLDRESLGLYLTNISMASSWYSSLVSSDRSSSASSLIKALEQVPNALLAQEDRAKKKINKNPLTQNKSYCFSLNEYRPKRL